MLALWTIRPRLMAVPGVANVAIWGQRDRQYQVLVDPDRLRAHGVTLDAGRARRRRCRGCSAPAASSTRRTSGWPSAHLVADQHAPRTWRAPWSPSATARPSGSATWPTSSDRPSRRRSATPSSTTVPGLLLIVEKQPWGNTLDVTREVEAALDATAARPAGVEIDSDHLPPGDVHRDVARQPRRTPCCSAACWWSSSWSLFLFDWRTAFISLTAIPLSLLAAVAGRCTARGGTHQHDGAGRAGHRARRGGGRRHHRRGEHRAPAAAEPRCRPTPRRRSRSCSTPRSRCAAPSSTPA